jgi:glycerate 2-kinase
MHQSSISFTEPVHAGLAVSQLLTEMFEAAVSVAQPSQRLPAFLPQAPRGKTVVLGAGKASAAMAQALARHWIGPLEGLVMTRYGYAVPCERIEIAEAAHPVPDDAGLRAAKRILDRVAGLTEDDLVIGLISGGGSALLPLPADDLSLEVKQQINRALLAGGATIAKMNCVRHHLSAIKGGRLAAACYPARVVNLIISDVPADHVTDVASGPTVADPTTRADAIAVLDRYGIDVPAGIRAQLESGALETLKSFDRQLPSIETHFIATPQMALEAAATCAAKRGVATHILGDSIEGEAREVGTVMAGIAKQISQRSQPFTPPCILLSGGETTVTVRGHGRGGRNVEFLLALGLALNGMPDVFALAGDTDGVDGQEEIAGARLAPDSLIRARLESRSKSRQQ